MSQPLTVIQPQSFERFRCIDSACEDNCCRRGWLIPIDKRTHDKYQQCEDPVLRPLIDTNIRIISETRNKIGYAQIALEGGVCPFLNETHRCSIHERLGVDYLSRACSTYPRTFYLVDGVVECSLDLSCPEAARLVLLNPEAMRLETSVRSQYLRFAKWPTLDTRDRQYSEKPYEHFPAVRDLVNALLQDRNYAIWERLLILGFVCEHIDRVIAADSCGNLLELLDNFSKQIEGGLFASALHDVPNKPLRQIEFTALWVKGRISHHAANPRFLNTWREFDEAVCSAASDPATAYSQAYSRYYQPFMDSKKYIIENYLSNYVLNTLFPFGAQNGLNVEPKSVFAEYLLLVAHYAIVRSLLVGAAAYHQDSFDETHVVAVVQSFYRAMGHSRSLDNLVLQVLESRNLNNITYLSSLLKN